MFLGFHCRRYGLISFVIGWHVDHRLRHWRCRKHATSGGCRRISEQTPTNDLLCRACAMSRMRWIRMVRRRSTSKKLLTRPFINVARSISSYFLLSQPIRKRRMESAFFCSLLRCTTYFCRTNYLECFQINYVDESIEASLALSDLYLKKWT